MSDGAHLTPTTFDLSCYNLPFGRELRVERQSNSCGLLLAQLPLMWYTQKVFMAWGSRALRKGVNRFETNVEEC